MKKEEAMNNFKMVLAQKLEKEIDLKWDIDKKGVVSGWLTLTDSEEIYLVAEAVAAFNGRVMTISPLNIPATFTRHGLNEESSIEKPVSLVINYHFFFEGINCTVRITLQDIQRSVKSITPVLKSADWHEREFQELYNIKLHGHPNSKRLFLDENIYITDHTMIPLSEAMSGASTSTLWEKVMSSDRKGANTGE